jgi:pullulanase
MGVLPDLLRRRSAGFVLWRPAHGDPPPALVVGRFVAGDPPALGGERSLPLSLVAGTDDLWSISLEECDLEQGVAYHYFFELTDGRPQADGERIRCTDPTAWTVDWRLLSPPVEGRRFPAAVVRVQDGQLLPCDPDGGVPDWSHDGPISGLPANHRTVYYELPTQWTRRADENGVEIAAGTFRDVLALVDPDAVAPGFADIPALASGRAYLDELGVTTLELLPIADSCLTRGWKYGTSHYFAPDHTLGTVEGLPAPTPAGDLAALVSACHRAGLRFVLDAVMAFGREDAYSVANFLDFHVQWSAGDPEQDGRDGWGGDLWKYGYFAEGYDPIDGSSRRLAPARRLMLAHIARWLLGQRIDGIRIDSVNNVANWEFVGEFTAYARSLYRGRAADQGLDAAQADARFLVVGEELAMPLGLLHQHRLDALWNEEFKYALRAALLGQARDRDPSFEWTVRKLVDCRNLGFADGAQAVNYVTSHDVENWESQRLYTYLNHHGVWDTEPRIKLAFSCLLTAVGIPMILAGEEFADQHDRAISSAKEVDPVNFNRLEDPWRRRVFDHVARLVRLRQQAPALSVNDTAFIHVDFTAGRRVLAWRRGGPGDDPVVVVANFSDWHSTPSDGAPEEYVVPAWPATPNGRHWREVTQARDVPDAWAGREPLDAWQANVYTLA